MLYPRLSDIHAQRQTPWAAVLLTGLLTALGVLLGKASLIPITEAGRSDLICPDRNEVVSFHSGTFFVGEWSALAMWLGLGLVVRWRRKEMVRPEQISAGASRT